MRGVFGEQCSCHEIRVRLVVAAAVVDIADIVVADAAGSKGFFVQTFLFYWFDTK